MRRVCRSRRSPTVSVARRQRSRATSTTHLMLTKDLLIAPQERQFSALAGQAWTSICKRLRGSRCDGTMPAFPTTRSVRFEQPAPQLTRPPRWLLCSCSGSSPAASGGAVSAPSREALGAARFVLHHERGCGRASVPQRSLDVRGTRRVPRDLCRVRRAASPRADRVRHQPALVLGRRPRVASARARRTARG
jgi:hypothetical protein